MYKVLILNIKEKMILCLDKSISITYSSICVDKVLFDAEEFFSSVFYFHMYVVN